MEQAHTDKSYEKLNNNSQTAEITMISYVGT